MRTIKKNCSFLCVLCAPMVPNSLASDIDFKTAQPGGDHTNLSHSKNLNFSGDFGESVEGHPARQQIKTNLGVSLKMISQRGECNIRVYGGSRRHISYLYSCLTNVHALVEQDCSALGGLEDHLVLVLDGERHIHSDEFRRLVRNV